MVLSSDLERFAQCLVPLVGRQLLLQGACARQGAPEVVKCDQTVTCRDGQRGVMRPCYNIAPYQAALAGAGRPLFFYHPNQFLYLSGKTS